MGKCAKQEEAYRDSWHSYSKALAAVRSQDPPPSARAEPERAAAFTTVAWAAVTRALGGDESDSEPESPPTAGQVWKGEELFRSMWHLQTHPERPSLPAWSPLQGAGPGWSGKWGSTPERRRILSSSENTCVQLRRARGTGLLGEWCVTAALGMPGCPWDARPLHVAAGIVSNSPPLPQSPSQGSPVPFPSPTPHSYLCRQGQKEPARAPQGKEKTALNCCFPALSGHAFLSGGNFGWKKIE